MGKEMKKSCSNFILSYQTVDVCVLFFLYLPEEADRYRKVKEEPEILIHPLVHWRQNRVTQELNIKLKGNILLSKKRKD